MSNEDVISGVSINGVEPTRDNISTKTYPISRSLYFYVKNSHATKVPAMREYIEMFMNEELVGGDGLLTEIGLIPLSEKQLKHYQVKAQDLNDLSLEELEKELKQQKVASLISR
jgi:phosphate transport system substrate-binding protein